MPARGEERPGGRAREREALLVARRGGAGSAVAGNEPMRTNVLPVVGELRGWSGTATWWYLVVELLVV